MTALVAIIVIVRRMSSLPAIWWERVEMRERLGAMPARLLADIGLDHARVAREVRRPFWRPLGECLGTGAAASQPAARSSAPVPVPAVLQPVARFAGVTFPILS